MTEYYKNEGLNGHGTVFLRGDLGPHCNESNCHWVGDLLCDFPVGNGRTCDRSLCDDHASLVAPDIHYCKAHLNEWETFKNKGGVTKELENVVPFKTKK